MAKRCLTRLALERPYVKRQNIDRGKSRKGYAQSKLYNACDSSIIGIQFEGGGQLLKKAKKFVSILLCVTMLFSCIGPISASAASVDVGTNPTPKIDIAVNVPSDYPGTFLDFKQELTQKLIEQGLNPSDFRITDTAAKIDTTDLNGWYVYDHYRNITTWDYQQNNRKNSQIGQQIIRMHQVPARFI